MSDRRARIEFLVGCVVVLICLLALLVILGWLLLTARAA